MSTRIDPSHPIVESAESVLRRQQELDVAHDMRELRESYGFILDWELDASLQSIVEVVRKETGFPVACVTLVLRKVQFFVAHVGLPPVVALARAADRGSSFCHNVVKRDGAVFVDDARLDASLPQDVVQRFGIVAYYGVPVRVQGRTIGALCVLDQQAHALGPEQQERMRSLAVTVSDRLEVLRDRYESGSQLLPAGTRPAFEELRNASAASSMNLELARRSWNDAQPLAELMLAFHDKLISAEDLAEALAAAPRQLARLRELGSNLYASSSAIDRMNGLFTGIEAAVIPRATTQTDLSDALATGENLAHHRTKLIGGVRWEGIPEGCLVRGRLQPLINLVSSTLSFIAEAAETQAASAASDSGIVARISRGENRVSIRLSCRRVEPTRWQKLSAIVRFNALGTILAVAAFEDGLVIDLPTLDEVSE